MTEKVLNLYLIKGSVLEAPGMVSFHRLQNSEIGSIWIIRQGQNLEELQGAPLAKSGALNGLRWRS